MDPRGVDILTQLMLQSLEGLRMVEFDPKNVKAHPKVLEFYKEMNRVP